ncbi:hypothetical protein [Legionella waltersii]|uniref:Uncharacterized protein n=1 Tax=Legionella waltersii TaxID=66969 RepID=A0A0W1A4M8_9GAMM|nr:hypothetical protein [Legionella waltersii]KTD76316.1 hypothetical protein Lwal_2038 [Legionella waltersii]SNV13663.1 Uncharacterised protein [Legionella waltersii]
MNNKSLLSPLFKKIDKLLFGIEEINEIEKDPSEFIDCDNEEEFDVQRSVN